MRSTIVAAAFAAGALAFPFQKRATITDYDIVYVTQVVTVTAGQEPSTTMAKPSTHHYTPPVHHSSSHYVPPVPTSKSSSTGKSSTKVVAPVSTSKTSTKSSTKAAAPTSTAKSSTTVAAPVSTSTTMGKSSTKSTSKSSTKSSTKAAAPTTTAKSSTHTTAAPSSSKATSTKQTSTSAMSAAPTSYEQIAVFHHNLHRSNHSAPDIKWDASLASTAQKIAQSCKYEHNTAVDGGGYGQNIAAGVKPDNISAIITDLFYNGEVGWFDGLYGEAQPDMTNFEHWGHFSQVVWKGSGSLGCYTQDCTVPGLQGVASDVPPFFTVCNYENPGNYANEYGANIGSPLGRATAEWNTGL